MISADVNIVTLILTKWVLGSYHISAISYLMTGCPQQGHGQNWWIVQNKNWQDLYVSKYVYLAPSLGRRNEVKEKNLDNGWRGAECLCTEH